MKVLSAMFSFAVVAQLIMMPLAASANGMNTTTTTTTQQSVLPVQGQSYDSSTCQPQTLCAPAVVQDCAPTVISQPCPTVCTQPAVVQECPRRNYWGWLAIPLLAGIATAIAVPIAVSHHHHHGLTATQIHEQQELLFASRATP
jgi:hypothetical protein